MAAAPRPKGKATAIAYRIMGVPAPMRSKKPKKQREIDSQLIVQETQRSR